MTSASTTHRIRPLRLRAGQALHFTVRPGTALQVLAGSVRVCEPSRWLAERVITPSRTLHEAQALRIEDGGWIEVLAQGGEAQVLAIEPASTWTLLWRWLLPRRPLVRQGCWCALVAHLPAGATAFARESRNRGVVRDARLLQPRACVTPPSTIKVEPIT